MYHSDCNILSSNAGKHQILSDLPYWAMIDGGKFPSLSVFGHELDHSRIFHQRTQCRLISRCFEVIWADICVYSPSIHPSLILLWQEKRYVLCCHAYLEHTHQWTIFRSHNSMRSAQNTVQIARLLSKLGREAMGIGSSMRMEHPIRQMWSWSWIQTQGMTSGRRLQQSLRIRQHLSHRLLLCCAPFLALPAPLPLSLKTTITTILKTTTLRATIAPHHLKTLVQRSFLTGMLIIL